MPKNPNFTFAVSYNSITFAIYYHNLRVDASKFILHRRCSLYQKMKIKELLFLTAWLASTCVSAQGTLNDYNRAYSLGKAFSADSVYYWARDVAWCDSTHKFHYNVSTPEGRRFVLYDADSGEKTIYTSIDELNRVLGIARPVRKPAFGRRHERHWMEVDEEKDAFPVASPDGRQEAYIEGCNVVLHKVGRPYTEKHVLTQDGTLGCYYSNRILWSPDGKYIFVCKRRPVEKRYAYYVESSPTDQLQPILHKQEYAKPGDALPQKYPTIIEVATGRRVEADATVLNNQYELGMMQWTNDSREVTMEYNQRGHKLYQLLAMDAQTGRLRVVVEERSDKFVNYPRIFRQFVHQGRQVVWTSERDQWNHLYLFDVVRGKMVRQITHGAWCVRDVQWIDEEQGEIYFSASGVNPDEDPYLIHYYKIGLDGRNLLCLTPGRGTHTAKYSSDHRYLVDSYSLVDTAPRTELRSAVDGSLVKVIEEADLSLIRAKGWRAPEPFVAMGRDGKTPMYGIIQRPSHFDATRSYPVIEYIYAGPGDAYTPKSFMPYNWNTTALAELGFIVVQLDAMGTAWRGKAFEEMCYKNLKDAGFPDRERWIKAACEKYPYMDSTRVGIFGASAGGQESTTAVLLHGDFYKAAYSSCGCHDNRMDKIWWNELWMGYPVDSSYVESSNVYLTPRLERPLMLVVGELDDNVDPSSTYQVADALIRAGKDFELVVLPGVHHSMGERFGEHKRFDFFVKHLLGVNPPKWADVVTQ